LSLKNIRINITSLLSMTLLQHFEGDFVISLSGPSATSRSSARFAWRDLQHGVFLLLSDVLDEMPPKHAKVLPRFWINGHDILLRATYAATTTSDRQSIPYRYADLDEASVHERGYHKISGLDPVLYPAFQDSPFACPR
jgi:hypothetical protein